MQQSLFRYCLYCNKQLSEWIYPSGGRRTRNKYKYCSRECSYLFRRGKHKTDHSKQAKNHTRIRVNGKRVYLHRYLVNKHIRLLLEGEIVHHKDDNKFNNTIDNLQILSGRSAHLHIHYRKKSGCFSNLVNEDCPF